MTRLPDLAVEDMSEEQQEIHRAIIAGPRGRIVGPLRAAIYSPDLARRWSPLGEYLRFNSSIPARLTELSILVTSRRWGCDVEWHIHSELALQAEIPADVIEAIRLGNAPTLENAEDAEVYEFCRVLQSTGFVDNGVYRALQGRHGHVGLVDLASIVGYYTMVAMTLNAHEISLPEVKSDIFPDKRLNQLGLARSADGTIWQWRDDGTPCHLADG